MMKKFFVSLFLLVIVVHVHANNGRIKIIPEPVSVTEKPGSFKLDNTVVILMRTNDKELMSTVQLFTKQIAASTGKDLKIITAPGKGTAKKILSIDDENGDTHKEGYGLSVSPNVISLKAGSNAGVFYGLQTLMQLLPPEVESNKMVEKNNWEIPCVEIKDYPRFAWRGMLLDPARHFLTKNEVEAFIDEMVKYKYNILHLHLSDDNGWRLEIKSLPRLTEFGSWRIPRTGRFWTFDPPKPGEKATDGGFYTQDEMREIIRYAQQRYVTILPEIDVPAHSLSLIASYPNLSCTQLQYQVNSGWDFWQKDDNVLCVGNDSVYMMLDKIFTEIAQLFPSEYIHVGGDEAYKGFWEKCPKCQKRMADEYLKNTEELQSYFIKRVEKIVQSKGKKLIGWDEILEGGLAPSATVMSWRGMQGGIDAAKMNHEVIMTPAEHCYIDLYQGDPSVETPTYSMCRLTDSYNWDPVPEGVDAKYILGGQANLWGEMVPTLRHAEYMTWPRGFALSEVFWSPKEKRNWDDFISRAEYQFKRLDVENIKYSTSMYDAVFKSKFDKDSSVLVDLGSELNGIDIYYTFDLTHPDNFANQYSGKSLSFPAGARAIKVITYRNGKPVGKEITVTKSDLAERAKQKND